MDNAKNCTESTAWMLRCKGNMISVPSHIYAREDDMAATAEAALFLMIHTETAKKIYQRTLCIWIALGIEEMVSRDADRNEIMQTVRNFLQDETKMFRVPLTPDEIMTIVENSEYGRCFQSVDMLYEYCQRVRDDCEFEMIATGRNLNSKFIRVRVGGMYDTDPHKLNEVYFRIASPGCVNWNEVIRTALTTLIPKYGIDTITICRDMETDKSPEIRYYRSDSGQLYDHQPVDLFLKEGISDYYHVYWDDGK